jgi:hypothetical protein
VSGTAGPQTALPGAIRQLGYVVPDLDEAMRSWLALGIGPWWTIREMPQVAFRHRGEPTEPVLSIAFSNSGPMQLELIQQHDDAPTAYREFLDAGGQGFHHLGFWTDDFAASASAAEAAGLHTAQEGDGMVRFAYYELNGATSTMLELMELTDSTRGLDDLVRGSAADWDGRTDPVRPLM